MKITDSDVAIPPPPKRARVQFSAQTAPHMSDYSKQLSISGFFIVFAIAPRGAFF